MGCEESAWVVGAELPVDATSPGQLEERSGGRVLQVVSAHHVDAQPAAGGSALFLVHDAKVEHRPRCPIGVAAVDDPGVPDARILGLPQLHFEHSEIEHRH